ncbi:hypothetical protein LJR234_004628 [Mesorhizobium amorphae]|uniref:hypothetical protein n=1 Tax=Mesorhizobium amorphae TaxID=71433 RepID=UPI003ED0E523
MQLNKTILDALASCGATEAEMASITAYYADQLTAAEASVAQIRANIDSLQMQLGEESARADVIRIAIAKFVVADR